MFKNKTLLITGGTGSFGNCVLDRFLNTEIHEIRIFPADGRGLNYENYIDLGFVENNDDLVGYNSSNSKKLTVSEIKEKLLKIPEIRKELGLES